jgi:thioredoxin reductase
MIYDAIIVGGSYAGMSAALQLARARRSILVVDAGRRRNRFASHSHGFLGRDGADPGRIAEQARAQILRYDTVVWQDGTAEDARTVADGVAVDISGNEPAIGRRLILATGVRDILPDIPGLKERWGKSVFHCPYCHGYELQQGDIGVLATSEMSMHQALMLPDWGKTTLFLNGMFEPDMDQLRQLDARGVTVERTSVERISGDGADVVLIDGRTVFLRGLFIVPRTETASPLARRLGCRLEESPLGHYIATDAMKQTTVKGIFACGDAARAAGSVAFAVGDGAQAGLATHRSLMFGDG